MLLRATAEALRPEPHDTVSQWADKNRHLTSVSSARPGQWRTSLVPYMREIMDAMSPSHPCTDGAFVKGTQIAGSEGLYNIVGAYIDQAPCPILVLMPTSDMAKLTSEQRIAPMIEESPVLSAKIKPARSRDSANTVLKKNFPGGVLRLVGANSGSALRSMPVRVLLMDEIDAYPASVDSEGDPCALAEKRTETFAARAKRMRTSTPKHKGSSPIERSYFAGSQARYYVPCPLCEHEQPLDWEQMRWSLLDNGDLNAVWYECVGCGESIAEHHKPKMLARGRHVHRAPGAGEFIEHEHPHQIWVMTDQGIKRFRPRYTKALSWQVSALYSPLGFTWNKAVAQYLEAMKGGYDEESGETLTQVFYNTVRGEAYETPGERPEHAMLETRAETYQRGTVPAGGLILTAGVDVQGDRLEVAIKAYGEHEESWLVQYEVLDGNPIYPEVWRDLLDLLAENWKRESGAVMNIAMMAIDSGYMSQEVYSFCRDHQHKQIMATKGSSQPGKAILGSNALVDLNARGKKVKNGVRVWQVGTDTAKERIYKRLTIPEAGPAYMHFPHGLASSYYEGLTAEKLVRERGVNKWKKVYERNEPLDLEVLCYVSAIRIGIQRRTWSWNGLKESLHLADELARRGVNEATPVKATRLNPLLAQLTPQTNKGAVDDSRPW